MKNTYKLKIAAVTVIMILTALLSSCEDYLDQKPSKSQVIPSTLSELEGLLYDNSIGMNQDLNLGHLAVDDFELSSSALLQLRQLEFNSYIWENDPYLEEVSGEWSTYYKQVYNANLVLEGIESLEKGGKSIPIDHVRGKALFTKAQAYFFLLQSYSEPFDPLKSNVLLGVPIRNTTDINKASVRPSMEESYLETERLLLEALEFLPQRDETRKTPSRWAAYALLARLYLVKGDYEKSLSSVDKALAIGRELIDYNSLDASAIYPFPEFGLENIYNVTLGVRSFWTSSGTGVSSELYSSYDSADLRKKLFFEQSPEGVMIFKGTYTGNYERFAGYGVDELYLMRAECLARLGQDPESRDAINYLLRKRYEAGAYEDLEELTGKELLKFILTERRKELVFRNIRWVDLRRLNREEQFQKTLTRTANGSNYSLAPGAFNYTFPIPLDEIRLNALIQNRGYE